MTDLITVTAAAARAVSQLHRPVPTDQGVEACEHCTSLRQVHIVRWPCPTRKHADRAGQQAGAIDTSVSPGERIADAIEAEEHRLRRLTPGHADWQTPDFRMGMLHAAAIARSQP